MQIDFYFIAKLLLIFFVWILLTLFILFILNSRKIYFALKEINGGVAKINGEEAEKGIKPNLTSKNVLTIKRMVLYGQNEKIIEFTIWE